MDNKRDTLEKESEQPVKRKKIIISSKKKVEGKPKRFFIKQNSGLGRFTATAGQGTKEPSKPRDSKGEGGVNKVTASDRWEPRAPRSFVPQQGTSRLQGRNPAGDRGRSVVGKFASGSSFTGPSSGRPPFPRKKFSGSPNSNKPFSGPGVGKVGKSGGANSSFEGGKPAAKRVSRVGNKGKEREKSYSAKRNLEKEFELAYYKTQRIAESRANPIPKTVEMGETITVAELARKMNLKASVIIGKLWEMGVTATLNQRIDADTASIVVHEYGSESRIISLYEQAKIAEVVDAEESLQPRPPIVTVMGHVDHGKTSLLDVIREADSMAVEAGGITQHIGAYQVTTPKGAAITFLDTPGHEAFSQMRAKGVQATDIVVLVVAANDGVKNQTLEAIKHAKAAAVPIIVAINKVDLPTANSEHVKTQLSELDLIPEDWGGQTLYVHVSALKKQGIQELLEAILLQAEILQLRVNANRLAKGVILESRLDKGKGVIATVLVQKGTLQIGDFFVGGVYPGKVRLLSDDHGKLLKKAGPSVPIEVMGFEGLPQSGDPFDSVESDRQAKEVAQKRQELQRGDIAQSIRKVSTANVYQTIEGAQNVLVNTIIKSDVFGSAEALKTALEKLGTDELRFKVVHYGVGAITENDVNLAVISKAIVLAFHVSATKKAQDLASNHGISIRRYNVIYKAIEDMEGLLKGYVKPVYEKKEIGQVMVRQVFRSSKTGVIAGSYVSKGKVIRSALVKVERFGETLAEDEIVSLKRFKEDAKEVNEGYECGIVLKEFQDLQIDDVLLIYDLVKSGDNE